MRASETSSSLRGEVTELLAHLIRNACVNDGSVASGQEARSAATLAAYFADTPLEVETFESAPGRTSLVARIEGRRPEAPTLLLMGHTDVVPVNPTRWRHDPFGGELIDGAVWGRGAIDMLNLTASMAVATRHLARRGFAPDGTLVYLAVADEEALGRYGADHLLTHERDAVRADYVITESGGIPVDTPGGLRLPVMVGEKGSYWCRLRIGGTPGHGSQPYRTDNALVKAAAVVQRLQEHRPETRIHEIWRRFLDGLGLPDELRAPLLSPESFLDALELLPPAMGRLFHACTHTTIAPTTVRGGTKINVIPDLVELEVDIRTLPGQTDADIEALLAEALGDLAGDVEIERIESDLPSASPIETPLWDALQRAGDAFYAGSAIVPLLSVGATDARFFRRAGSTAYGFGMFSRNLTFEDYGTMFHGDDERVDVDSLVLSTDLWDAVARDLLEDHRS
jgi:acetylornithine deacetylase/succinyl-diaminopimelate desuccinylase-like protein